MNREQALAEVRRSAERRHGTLVRALTLILGRCAQVRGHIAGHIAEHIAEHLDAPGGERHVGCLPGAGEAVAGVEEALFEAFAVWPDEPETVPGSVDRLPGRERAAYRLMGRGTGGFSGRCC